MDVQFQCPLIEILTVFIFYIFIFFLFVYLFFVCEVLSSFSACLSKENEYSTMIGLLLFVLHPLHTVVDELMFHPEAWSIST